MTVLPSVDPSSTMMTSRSLKVCRAIDSSSVPRWPSALRNGTTTLSLGTGQAPPGLVTWPVRDTGPYQTDGAYIVTRGNVATVWLYACLTVHIGREPAAGEEERHQHDADDDRADHVPVQLGRDVGQYSQLLADQDRPEGQDRPVPARPAVGEEHQVGQVAPERAAPQQPLELRGQAGVPEEVGGGVQFPGERSGAQGRAVRVAAHLRGQQEQVGRDLVHRHQRLPVAASAGEDAPCDRTPADAGAQDQVRRPL